MKTAKQLALLYKHPDRVSFTTLKTIVNEDASDGHDEMKDLNVSGIGNNAYFEWVNECGDPMGDVFYTLEIDSSELPETYR